MHDFGPDLGALIIEIAQVFTLFFWFQGQLLDTMSLTEAVPAFRTKQWRVIVLLFLDALCLHRLPALARQMANRNMLLHKVFFQNFISFIFST